MARQRPPWVRAIERTSCFTLRHTSDILPRATAPMKDTDAGVPDRQLSPDPKAPASVPPNRESSWDNLKS